MKFEDVVAGWQTAPVTAIHPLRKINETEYWASGVYQAREAAKWIPEGGSVIDFGCGDGRLTLPLARMGFTVTAVDASRTMLDRLWGRLTDGQDDHLKLATLRSDGIDLAIQTEPVDVIVARAVLIHHSHADVARLVQALAACLKPGGVFIADWPLGKHHERRDWLDVTTWEESHRLQVGTDAGLELVEDATPTVWRKI